MLLWGKPKPQSGTVIASVETGAVTDVVGNPSSASTGDDNTFTYVAPAPDCYLVNFETAPANRLVYSVKLGSGIVHQGGNTPKSATVPVVGKRCSGKNILEGHQARVLSVYGSKRLTIANPDSNVLAPQGGRIKLSFTNFDPVGVTLNSLTLSNLTPRGAYLTFYYMDGSSSRQNLGTTASGKSLVVPLNAQDLRAVDILALNAYAVDDVAFTDEVGN